MDPLVQAREQGKCSLALHSLESHGELRLRATGVSMLPTIVPGDVLHIKRVNFSQLAPGDVILYRRADALFVHRVVAINGLSGRLITRGDSMAAPDPEVETSCLLGKIDALERKGRPFHFTNRLNPFSRFAGLVLCHSSRLRGLYLRWQSSETLVNSDALIAE